MQRTKVRLKRREKSDIVKANIATYGNRRGTNRKVVAARRAGSHLVPLTNRV